MLIRDGWQIVFGEMYERNHIFKMDDSSKVLCVKEMNTDKKESENSEENTSHEDILPGFKTFEEFREVG